jgi:hypothetical protein
MEITQRDLLTFNGMIITGMLFVFGLSSEISKKLAYLWDGISIRVFYCGSYNDFR